MAAEAAIVGISILAASFLWYANELQTRNSFLWGQFFQILSFLFMMVDAIVMVQMFRAESLFDMEDLVFFGIFYLILATLTLVLMLWTWNLVMTFLKTLKTRKLQTAKGIGSGGYGPE
jgi:hypothetical protein